MLVFLYFTFQMTTYRDILVHLASSFIKNVGCVV